MKAGLIVGVVGACVDVQFRSGALPNLFDALIVEDLGLTLETHQYCEQAVVRTIALGPVEGLRRGMRVVSLDKPLSFPIGSGLLGRTLNGLGEPIDDLGPLKSRQRLPVRRQPMALGKHAGTIEILETGIKAVDLLCPIFKGGLVGVFGSLTGQTERGLINAIVRNLSRNKLLYCVYTALSGRTDEIGELRELLRSESSSMAMIVASVGESCGRRFTACLGSLTLAEYFRDTGHDVVLVLDDVGQYIQAGRELSGWLRRVPSYGHFQPTLFQEIASLEERICSTDIGFLTSLQVIQTPSGDVADAWLDAVSPFIDTSILTSDKNFFLGILPAIDFINSRAHHFERNESNKKHHETADAVRALLVRRDELVPIVRTHGFDELHEDDRICISRARKIERFLSQPVEWYEVPKYVELSDTIAGFEEIIDGNCDHLPEQAFYMVGAINEVYKKAELISA